MLKLQLKMNCDQEGCDASVDILVNWSEINLLDLNSKRIEIPGYLIYDIEWAIEDYNLGYGSGEPDYHYLCPKCKKC